MKGHHSIAVVYGGKYFVAFNLYKGKMTSSLPIVEITISNVYFSACLTSCSFSLLVMSDNESVKKV